MLKRRLMRLTVIILHPDDVSGISHLIDGLGKERVGFAVSRPVGLIKGQLAVVCRNIGLISPAQVAQSRRCSR